MDVGLPPGKHQWYRARGDQAGSRRPGSRSRVFNSSLFSGGSGKMKLISTPPRRCQRIWTRESRVGCRLSGIKFPVFHLPPSSCSAFRGRGGPRQTPPTALDRLENDPVVHLSLPVQALKCRLSRDAEEAVGQWSNGINHLSGADCVNRIVE